MNDKQLANWIKQMTGNGESEINFAIRKLTAAHRARLHRPVSHARVAQILRENFGSERRGNLEVVPRGIAV